MPFVATTCSFRHRRKRTPATPSLVLTLFGLLCNFSTNVGSHMEESGCPQKFKSGQNLVSRRIPKQIPVLGFMERGQGRTGSSPKASP